MNFAVKERMSPELNELLSAFDRVNELRRQAGLEGLSDATLGSYAVSNYRFVSRLRDGETRRIHPDIMRRAKAWIKAESAKYAQKGRAKK